MKVLMTLYHYSYSSSLETQYIEQNVLLIL